MQIKFILLSIFLPGFHEVFFSLFIRYGQDFFEAKIMMLNITLSKPFTTFGKGHRSFSKTSLSREISSQNQRQCEFSIPLCCWNAGKKYLPRAYGFRYTEWPSVHWSSRSPYLPMKGLDVSSLVTFAFQKVLTPSQ